MGGGNTLIPFEQLRCASAHGDIDACQKADQCPNQRAGSGVGTGLLKSDTTKNSMKVADKQFSSTTATTLPRALRQQISSICDNVKLCQDDGKQCHGNTNNKAAGDIPAGQGTFFTGDDAKSLLILSR